MSGTLDLTAPIDGYALPLSAVGDPLYSGLLLGDGVAIEPLAELLVAPCDGVVSCLPAAGHALALDAGGVEIFIHIGIGAAALEGRGFTPLVKQGDAVRRGQALVAVDIDAVARCVQSLQVVVIVTGPQHRLSRQAAGRVRAGRDLLFAVKVAGQQAPAVCLTADGTEVRLLSLSPDGIGPDVPMGGGTASPIREDNPALGLRGIRAALAEPALLDAQLRALLSRRPLSQTRILLAMIADAGEVLRVRARIEALADEMNLTERPQLGVTVAVPAAALLAEHLAREVDFFWIDSDDLAQYALAMDRRHAGLAGRLDAMHPALLRLIAMTVAGARRHRKRVGLCGAMAADPEALPVLLGLGVTELSVESARLPEIGRRLRQLSQAQCRAEVPALLQLDSAEAVRAAARLLWPSHPIPTPTLPL